MHKRKLITFFALFLFITLSFSYSFALNETSNTKNVMMSAGNSIGNAAVSTKNALTTGMQDIGNGLSNMGSAAMNTMENATNGMTSAFTMENSNYEATRTATNNNLLGLSDTAWTWLIVGIIGAAIVGLVWYYGAQYEHKNYDHN